jgi:hypothetical protein
MRLPGPGMYFSSPQSPAARLVNIGLIQLTPMLASDATELMLRDYPAITAGRNRMVSAT